MRIDSVIGVPPLCRLHALEETCRAHSTADAHRHDGEFSAASFQFMERGCGELCAGATERMSERDRAAVHVDLFVGDAELLLAVAGLARERLVHLEEIDVL